MKKSDFRRIVREVLVDVLRSDITEDTTLRGLVAKSQSEKLANAAVAHLQKNDISARTTYPAKFGLQSDEVDGWGIFVEPDNVQTAAKILASVAKGLTFDPYVNVK